MARRKPKPDQPATPTTDEPPAAAETVGPVAVAETDTETAPNAARDDEPPAAPAAAADAPTPGGPKPFVIQSDAVTGVALREDKRFRQAQLQFRDKPSDAVRMIVREAGFTWQPTDRVWVKPIDREAGWKTRLDAERLYKEVVEEIAHEQGHAQTR